MKVRKTGLVPRGPPSFTERISLTPTPIHSATIKRYEVSDAREAGGVMLPLAACIPPIQSERFLEGAAGETLMASVLDGSEDGLSTVQQRTEKDMGEGRLKRG